MKHDPRLEPPILYVTKNVWEEMEKVISKSRKDNTVQLFFAKDGYEAVSKACENTQAEINVDYCITNVIRLSHVN